MPTKKSALPRPRLFLSILFVSIFAAVLLTSATTKEDPKPASSVPAAVVKQSNKTDFK